jgi:hypothetical protein
MMSARKKENEFFGERHLGRIERKKGQDKKERERVEEDCNVILSCSGFSIASGGVLPLALTIIKPVLILFLQTREN